jgi:hypothetical protein
MDAICFRNRVKKLGKSGENGGKLGKHGANVREKDGKPQGSRWKNQGFDHLIRPKIYGFWILWDSTGISTAIVENWVQRWQKRVGKGVVPAKFIFWGVCIPCESYIHIYIYLLYYIYILYPFVSGSIYHCSSSGPSWFGVYLLDMRTKSVWSHSEIHKDMGMTT